VSQFLSEAFMAEATTALNADPAFTGAIGNVDLAIQFTITDAPAGEVVYGLSIADGAAEMALGEVTDADLEVTNDYATAVGISTGELNTQMAFMTGKLKVTGDMAKLMLNQHVINAFAPALSGLDVEY
jgi:putative sterol carrier protein